MKPSKKYQKKQSFNFLSDYLGTSLPLPFSGQIINSLSQKIIYNSDKNENFDYKGKIHTIIDFPDYLSIKLPEKHMSQKIGKVNTIKGMLINLNNYENIDDYLKKKFGKTSRSKLRRYQNRLELCFNIRYKMYWGEIDKEEYDDLFDAFREMLLRRFKQKKESEQRTCKMG